MRTTRTLLSQDRDTPPDRPSPPWTESQTVVKTLPPYNFVVGSKIVICQGILNRLNLAIVNKDHLNAFSLAMFPVFIVESSCRWEGEIWEKSAWREGESGFWRVRRRCQTRQARQHWTVDIRMYEINAPSCVAEWGDAQHFVLLALRSVVMCHTQTVGGLSFVAKTWKIDDLTK